MAEIHDVIVSKIVPVIEEHGIKNVCDYGCGDGELLMKLQAKVEGLTLTGIDHFKYYGEEVVNEIKDKGINAINHGSDEYKEITTTGKFDLIISTFALHHFQYPVSELQAICSMVKPGGLIMLFDHSLIVENRANVATIIASYRDEITRTIKQNGYHRHHYTFEEVEDLIKALDVKVVKAEIFKNEYSDDERAEDKEHSLKRNREVQAIIKKNAPEFWQSVWLPIFQLEEKLIDDNGVEYSNFLCFALQKEGESD